MYEGTTSVPCFLSIKLNSQCLPINCHLDEQNQSHYIEAIIQMMLIHTLGFGMSFSIDAKSIGFFKYFCCRFNRILLKRTSNSTLYYIFSQNIYYLYYKQNTIP